MASPRYTAIVRVKTTYRIPQINSAAKPLLVGPDGKELPKDDKTGAYVGTGQQKIETTTTEAVMDPLMHEDGTPIETGSPEALLRKVKEHFQEEEENVEVLSVAVQETRTVRELTGAELAAVK